MDILLTLLSYTIFQCCHCVGVCVKAGGQCAGFAFTFKYSDMRSAGLSPSPTLWAAPRVVPPLPEGDRGKAEQRAVTRLGGGPSWAHRP